MRPKPRIVASGRGGILSATAGSLRRWVSLSRTKRTQLVSTLAIFAILLMGTAAVISARLIRPIEKVNGPLRWAQETRLLAVSLSP